MSKPERRMCYFEISLQLDNLRAVAELTKTQVMHWDGFLSRIADRIDEQLKKLQEIEARNA